MIAFPEMLVTPAKEAGILVPDDVSNYELAKYPHWHVYQLVQLGAPLPRPTSHWENARVIADITLDRITEVTFEDLVNAGLDVGYPIP